MQKARANPSLFLFENIVHNKIQMLSSKIFLILFIVLGSFAANAKIDYWLWQPNSADLPFVLVSENGMTAEQAARKYVESIKREPDLKELLSSVLEGFTQGKVVGKLNDKKEWGLAAANVSDDYINNGKLQRVRKLKAASRKKNFQYYLFPVAGTKHLSVDNQKEALDHLAYNATLYTSLGGPDVAADFYDEKNYHCRNCNISRDAEEFRLIKAMVDANRATILSFCRGHQMMSVYLGHKMVQDIPSQLGSPVNHSDEWHWISLRTTPYGYLQRAFPYKDRIFVNSIHHQAVLEKQNTKISNKPKTFIAATAEDGVIESLEFSMGLLVQFHPELQEELWPIVWTMIDVARERQPNRMRFCDAALM